MGNSVVCIESGERTPYMLWLTVNCIVHGSTALCKIQFVCTVLMGDPDAFWTASVDSRVGGAVQILHFGLSATTTFSVMSAIPPFPDKFTLQN